MSGNIFGEERGCGGSSIKNQMCRTITASHISMHNGQSSILIYADVDAKLRQLVRLNLGEPG